MTPVVQVEIQVRNKYQQQKQIWSPRNHINRKSQSVILLLVWVLDISLILLGQTAHDCIIRFLTTILHVLRSFAYGMDWFVDGQTERVPVDEVDEPSDN